MAPTREELEKLDRADPLSGFRARFDLPRGLTPRQKELFEELRKSGA